MALKKSQLYSSLWQSCDELRGGMDASQYKDYVLTLLFMKYVSDRYAGRPDALIVVPEGGGFADMVKLKGDKEIGDRTNEIIGNLAEANDLKGVIDQADFNDSAKLGAGKEMQDRLSKLVAIFDGWRETHEPFLKAMEAESTPKEIIHRLSEVQDGPDSSGARGRALLWSGTGGHGRAAKEA